MYLGDRVVALSPDTGRIASIISIDIERPRHVYSPEFVELRHKIMEQVRGEAV